MTTTTKRIQTLVNIFLRRLRGVWWPETIGKLTTVATYISNATGSGEPVETLDMDWLHYLQSSCQHYMTILNLESGGENEKRTTEKHVASRAWLRRQENVIQLDTVGEIGSELECLVYHVGCLCPRRGY